MLETLITCIHRSPAPCFAAQELSGHVGGSRVGAHRGGRWLTHLFRVRMVRNPRTEGGLAASRDTMFGGATPSGCSCGPLSQTLCALMRCQYGPLASAALTALPTSRATRLDPQPCRRFFLPLPLSSYRTCRCGRLLDVCGHPRAACSRWARGD